MARATRSLRLIEIAFWVLGVSLLGAAFGDTRERLAYQSQQERVLLGGPAVSTQPALRHDAAPPALAAIDFDREPDTARETVALPEPEPAAAITPPAKPAATSPRRAVKKKAPADVPTAFGRLEIPRLGMAAIVAEGGDEETFARAVGLVPGSPHPGDAGNVVLAGHRDTFFWPLRKIRLNDRIRLVVPPHTYEYEVRSVRVVEPEDTSVLDSGDAEELTLVTCYPFRFVGPAPERFIVRAARVN